MCIVSLIGGKIDHTVGGQNQFSFQNEYMMIVPAETWPTTKVKRTSMLKARVFPNYKNMIRIIHFCIVLTANTCSLHENQHYHV